MLRLARTGAGAVLLGACSVYDPTLLGDFVAGSGGAGGTGGTAAGAGGSGGLATIVAGGAQGLGGAMLSSGGAQGLGGAMLSSGGADGGGGDSGTGGDAVDASLGVDASGVDAAAGSGGSPGQGGADGGPGGADSAGPPTCSDRVANGTESDIDCGGTCIACSPGRACRTGLDCTEQVCSGGTCSEDTCLDGVRNGAETDRDCGGGICPLCAAGSTCLTGGDCASAICAGVCVAAGCGDGAKNGQESDTDCGGLCAKCDAGLTCNTSADCKSGVCTGTQCQTPTCTDGVRNGAELSSDCGGGSCPGCVAGLPCAAPSDCLSRVCTGDLCQGATCTDGVRNGAETSVDCGGGTCLPCGYRKALTVQGAQVAAALVDFPVLVLLVDAQLSAARADGADLVFRDASGALLDAEVESFVRATGRLTAWVRVPLVAAGTNTVFYVHYGDTVARWNAPSGYNPGGVWRGGYTRVWHLQDVGNLSDAKGTGNATNNGAANTPGLIGGAASFDGNDNLFAAHLPIDGASFTVSMWLRRADVGVDRCPLAQGRIGVPPGVRQMFHFCYEQDGSPGINNHFRFGFWGDDLLSINAHTDTTNYEYWVGTFDTSSRARALYRNGTLEGSDTTGGSLSTGSDPLEFGRRVYFWDYPWRGNLDEVRVASVPRSAAWIAAEYANQRAGSAFLTVGAQEAL